MTNEYLSSTGAKKPKDTAKIQVRGARLTSVEREQRRSLIESETYSSISTLPTPGLNVLGDRESNKLFKQVLDRSLSLDKLPLIYQHFVDILSRKFNEIAKHEGLIDEDATMDLQVFFLKEEDFIQLYAANEYGRFHWLSNLITIRHFDNQSPQNQLVEMSALVHECRHRVVKYNAVDKQLDDNSREVFFYPGFTGFVRDDNGWIDHDNVLEELFAVGWTNEHFHEFVPVELMREHNELVSALGHSDGSANALFNPDGSLNTKTSMRGNHLDLFLLLRNSIPDFLTLLTNARNHEHSFPQLARVLVKEFGRPGLLALTYGTDKSVSAILDVFKPLIRIHRREKELQSLLEGKSTSENEVEISKMRSLNDLDRAIAADYLTEILAGTKYKGKLPIEKSMIE